MVRKQSSHLQPEFLFLKETVAPSWQQDISTHLLLPAPPSVRKYSTERYSVSQSLSSWSFIIKLDYATRPEETKCKVVLTFSWTKGHKLYTFGCFSQQLNIVLWTLQMPLIWRHHSWAAAFICAWGEILLSHYACTVITMHWSLYCHYSANNSATALSQYRTVVHCALQ